MNGRRTRILNIIDDYNREALAVEVAYSYPAERVVMSLELLEMERGLPTQIRVDNGPEFISKRLKEYCNSKGIKLEFIKPGKPTQNAYIERFNRLFREDILNAYLFESISEAQELADKWRNDYNQLHPHGSLGGLSPLEYQSLNNKKIDSPESEKVRDVIEGFEEKSII